MKLVFATHNKNKLREVKSLMPLHIELLSLDDIGCSEDIPETSKTIEGNALIKSRFVKDHYGYDCFADDTGLEVEVLNNAPGVYSARYAGEACDPKANIEKLLGELKNYTVRNARFKTVIAISTGKDEFLFTGICEGEIMETPKGEMGFGYDPIFKPKGFENTFAEMLLEQKSRIGHRGKAIRKLIAYLSGE